MKYTLNSGLLKLAPHRLYICKSLYPVGILTEKWLQQNFMVNIQNNTPAYFRYSFSLPTAHLAIYSCVTAYYNLKPITVFLSFSAISKQGFCFCHFYQSFSQNLCNLMTFKSGIESKKNMSATLFFCLLMYLLQSVQILWSVKRKGLNDEEMLWQGSHCSG